MKLPHRLWLFPKRGGLSPLTVGRREQACPEALSDFASALLDAGVPHERLARMMRAEPLAAIGVA
jgi:hypothetical protein